MTGQLPKPLKNLHSFFHREIAYFLSLSLFHFFFFFLIEDDMQNLCIMLATGIVMNYTTQVAEGRGKNLYINLGYFIVAFLLHPALLVKRV